MSLKFFTFVGVFGAAPWNPVSLSGILPGDRIKQVVAVNGPSTGDFTGNFAPYAPAGDVIIQAGVDLSAHTLLLIVERVE